MPSKAPQWFLITGLLLAMVLALALRLPDLSARPMHNDEAVNAIKLRGLMEQGTYRYDPHEYHGPTLYYFALAWTRLADASAFPKLTEAQLRGLTVLFGAGLILLLPLVSDGLGRRATVFAALFTAISPAMVFYSRYFIHETLLVFFTFLFIAAGWRWYRSRKIGWAIVAGTAIGLMHTTKETFVLAAAAIVVAVFLNGKWSRRLFPGDSLRVALDRSRSRQETELTGGHRNPPPYVGGGSKRRRVGRHLVALALAWLVVAVLFYSSFFTHWSGVVDSIKTYLPMTHRAAGESAHVHPWNFYFERLLFFRADSGPVWTEALVAALAGFGVFSAFTRRGAADSQADFARFMAIYTMALAAIYSVIPYKTPWCALGFWHGAILLAGLGSAALFSLATRIWSRLALWLLLLAGAGWLAFQAWRASVTLCADPRNPYVYAQTSPDVLELVTQLNSLAGVSPEGKQTIVTVVAPGSDYWPLPWYLRGFERTGWWSELPDEFPGAIVVAANEYAAALESRGYVVANTFQLRPGKFLVLGVRPELWRAYVGRSSRTED